MDVPRMRPVFAVPLERPDALLPALRTVLAKTEGPCVGTIFRGHAVLHISDAERHFWSPHLYLEVRAEDDDDEYGAHDGPHLHGRFAPHPHVWTLFMAIYGLLGLAGVAGGIWGFSVWTLGGSPFTMLSMPGAVALIAFTYGATFIGQGLGSAQMYELRKLVDAAVDRSRQEEG